MKEELVSLKIGKLAKEKNFDWNCRTIYHPDNLEKTSSQIQHLPFNGLNNKVFKKTVNCFTLPTQSLLQRWLREEYGQNIYIVPCTKKNKVGYCYSLNSFTKIEEYSNYFETYEEALEEALYEGLKLIT